MKGPHSIYLIAYNVACCAGWATVWLLAAQSMISQIIDGRSAKTSLSELYKTPGLEGVLVASQVAALLEIVHAFVKLVRSPVSITLRQVSTRIFSLVAVVYSPQAQGNMGTGIMILSWATVEVPRYLFYVFALITGDSAKKTPFPLFWLRYSLFYVLYPSGILGELLVFYHASRDDSFVDWFSTYVAYFYSTLLPIIYAFGAPFMVYNMVLNRQAAFAVRFARPTAATSSRSREAFGSVMDYKVGQLDKKIK